MPITQKQLESRRKHIGGSDVPAILGLSPWANAHDVYLQKTGEFDAPKEAIHLTAGSFVEDGILNWAKVELGPMTKNQFRSAPEFYLGTHADAILDGNGRPVECKNVGAFGPHAEAFDPSIVDGVPDYVIAQCHAHMIAGSVPEQAHVPVLIQGNQLHMFTIEYDADIGEAIKQCCVDFWEEHVLKRIPPPDCLPSLSLLKRLKRDPGKIVEIDPDLLRRWLAYKATVTAAEKEFRLAEAELLAAMEDGYTADCGEVGTWRLAIEKAGDKIDRQAMKIDGVYETYATPNTRKMPRYKKAKGDASRKRE